MPLDSWFTLQRFEETDMKYIDAEKLVAEIERLKSTNPSEYNYQNAEGYVWALDDLLSFLDTLSEEPDKSLEEKTCKGFEEEFRRFIKKEKEKEPDKSLPYYGDYGIYRVARHFAQWGADHAPLPEDTVIFNKGVAEGKRLMLEEAVEYCRKRGLEFYAVNSSTPEEDLFHDRNRTSKVLADIYIDDRNLGGIPDWGTIYEMVLNLRQPIRRKRPWWKKLFRR